MNVGPQAECTEAVPGAEPDKFFFFFGEQEEKPDRNGRPGKHETRHLGCAAARWLTLPALTSVPLVMSAAERRYLHPTLKGVRSAGTCSLTVFGHIPKTGGTTVDDLFWALANARPPEVNVSGRMIGNWSAVSEGSYVATNSISHHFPNDVLHAILGLRFQRHKVPTLLPSWHRTHIYHSYHPHGRDMRLFLSHLPQLRKMYRDASCMLQVVTVVREPKSLQRSAYRYFRLDGGLGVVPSLSRTSSVRRNATLLADDLALWLAQNPDRQSRWLNSGISSTLNLSTPLHYAQLLAAYDYVAPSARLNEFLWFLMARIGVYLPASHSEGAPGPLSARLPSCNSNAGSEKVLNEAIMKQHVQDAFSLYTTNDALLFRVATARYAADVAAAEESRSQLAFMQAARRALANGSTTTQTPRVWPIELHLNCHKGRVPSEVATELRRTGTTHVLGENALCPAERLICVQGAASQRW